MNLPTVAADADPVAQAGRDAANVARRLAPILLGLLIVGAFLFVTTLAALSSFTNVQHSAIAAGYAEDTAWWLPAMVDGGIFAFTGLGLFVSWRFRWHLPFIRVLVWALVGYTLFLNTVGAEDLWSFVAHSVGAVLVAAGAEVVELLLRKMHAAPAQLARRIPRRRWLARPLSTGRIWHLMHAWDMTYAEVLASERQRIREKILDDLRRRGSEGDTDAQLMRRAKPRARQLLRLMDAAVDAATRAEGGPEAQAIKPKPAPKPPAPPSPSPEVNPTPLRPPKPDAQPLRPAARGKTMDELVAEARSLAATRGVTPGQLPQRVLMQEFGIGSKKAAELAGMFKVADQLATNDELVGGLKERGIPGGAIADVQVLASPNGARS